MKFKINKPDQPREFGAWKKTLDEATEIPGETFDVDAAWSNVRARLHDEPFVEKKKPVPFYRFSAAAAAILFILLFITLDKPEEEKLIVNQPENKQHKSAVVSNNKTSDQPSDSVNAGPMTLPQPALASNQHKKNSNTVSQVNPATNDSVILVHKNPEPAINIIVPEPAPVEPTPLVALNNEIPEVHITDLRRKQSNSPMARSNQGRRLLQQAKEANVAVQVEEISERIIIH